MTKTLLFLTLLSSSVFCEEMIIGEEKIFPGIDLVFEAAPKDEIFPKEYYPSKPSSDLHIELLATWSKDNEAGFQAGGFVPYLDIDLQITSKNGSSKIYRLTPHINLKDSLHYAQNIKLPADPNESYKVRFKISPPSGEELGIHKDWKLNFNNFIKPHVFEYEDLDFKKVISATR